MIEIKTMRLRGVPLLGVETQDPNATIAACIKALNGDVTKYPFVQWDIVRGWQGINEPGKSFVKNELDPRMTLGESLAAMAGSIPGGSLAFIHNAQRVLERDGVAQGVWLCRDAFKAKPDAAATLVLLGPSLTLPAELASDVVMISEPPPSKEMIGKIIDAIYPPNLPALTPESKGAAVNAALGLLSKFDVEQTIALSLRPSGVDVQDVWKRKIARVKRQSGAEIWTGCPTFDSIAGCANIKSEITETLRGRRNYGCVLFLDEIEKMVAGAGTDSSGVTGKMLGQFLSWTQDRYVDGYLLLGVPGAGKSATAKAAAGTAGIPCFRLSMAEAQGSLVGQSEQNLKSALASVDATSGGNVLMLATCNSIESLAPELIGRFRLGTYFYDFPDPEENAALWQMYIKKYELPDLPIPSLTPNWVGREIESACYKAWLKNRPLVEVIKNFVPQCTSQKGKLNALRESVSGRFLSASRPGVFRAESTSELPFAGKGRTIDAL